MTIACPDCGTLQDLSPLRRGQMAQCRQCQAVLERTSGRSIGAALACALATFALLFPANILPLFTLHALGLERDSRLVSGLAVLWVHGWLLLALAIGAFALVLPLLRFGLLSAVLGMLMLERRPGWLGWAFRWAVRLDLWAMPDVCLIGFAVGYGRVAARTTVYIAPGGWCFIAAAMLAMLSRAALDRRTVWRAIAPERRAEPGEAVLSCTVCDLVLPLSAAGGGCPRCGARLRARQPEALAWTLALVVAGVLLYIPANVFPMTVTHFLGRERAYRIIDGVADLFGAGLWPLGTLIFCTSVAIPLLKLMGLGWCLLSVQRRSRRHLVLKTRLHRAIDEIGRWSNVDVFTIPAFVPVIHYRGLITSDAGRGAAAFLAVVVLTMFASRIFDARLLWDAAEAPG